MAVATVEKKKAFMTVDEVLTELGISRATLSRRQSQGYITPVRDNPALLKQPIKFRREDVERLKTLGQAAGE